MRRALTALAAVALVAILVIGLSQAGGDSGTAPAPERFDLAQAKRKLAGSPPPLASLHEQSSTILEGGADAFEKRLDSLKGHPVVINKWASWCRPCRAVNAADKRPAAERFLAERPLPYPSYEDPGEKIARSLKAAKYFPMTVFVDPRGRTYIHTGEYRSRADLEADIDRYL